MWKCSLRYLLKTLVGLEFACDPQVTSAADTISETRAGSVMTSEGLDAASLEHLLGPDVVLVLCDNTFQSEL